MRSKIVGFGMAAAMALTLGAAGCKKNQTQAPAPVTDANADVDPAAANLATAETLNPGTPTGTTSSGTPASGRVLGQTAQGPAPTQQGQDYQSQPGTTYDQNGYPSAQNLGSSAEYNGEVQAGQQTIEAEEPPPPLLQYDQPPAPEPNVLWTPGYWSYGPGGYYWVPGAWTAPPYAGALWTPPYWGYYSGHYRFHRGFWGLHVGFYGGVPYGCGYTGYGYEGGYWQGNQFYYNRAVNHIDFNRVHLIYNHEVPVVNTQRVSYNGGPGGWNVRPRPAEIAVLHEQRTPPMPTQVTIEHSAAQNPKQFFRTNRGAAAVAVRPEVVAAVHVQPPPAARGGFGRPAPAAPPRNAEPQRPAPEPQRNQPEPSRSLQAPPRNAPSPERGAPENRVPLGQKPSAGVPQRSPAEPQPTRQPQRSAPTPERQQPQPERQARPEPARPEPTQQARPEPQRAPEPQRSEPQRSEPQRAPEPQHTNPAPQRSAPAPRPQESHAAPPHEEHPKP